MVKDKSVIVVGAGASSEFGLPIGNKLLVEISNAFYKSKGNGGIDDETIYYALRLYANRYKSHNPSHALRCLLNAAESIKQAIPLSLSIDNLIDERKDEDVEICAKIAIAKLILDAERSSDLSCDSWDYQNLDFERSKETWLNSFFKILKQNCEFEKLHERLAQVKFVIFNYDRCIEHYIYYAIQTAYNVSKEDAKECMTSLEIYHPYGKVGSLPWMDEPNPIKYGFDARPEHLVTLIDELKTFTEGVDEEESEIISIRESIKEAKTVLFLGFGYHQLNLDLLYPNSIKHSGSDKVKYFGTTYGESNSNQEAIHFQLSKLANVPLDSIWLNKMTAFEIINEYWRELSLSN